MKFTICVNDPYLQIFLINLAFPLSPEALPFSLNGQGGAGRAGQDSKQVLNYKILND
jgi:hypothetical protein